jgi:hypothetical protein
VPCCDADTLKVGKEIINHNYFLRYTTASKYCKMFWLILKKPTSGELTTTKKN